uniref:DNA mismatch repair proteins mutS family domain-containing protein n=1 Tax=Tetradesmus obliquus TaxID=3088 RepID=A0A383WQ55_TETOB|eukprot:jgi/Sobl393_1/8944/SZX79354.1
MSQQQPQPDLVADGSPPATQQPSSNCFAAVIENRAKEVGVAVLDLNSLTLHLTQFIEAGRSYTTTHLLLDAHQPRQLVVVGSLHHEVAGAAGVNQVTAAAWEQVHLARSAFDDTKGILAVQELTGWNDMGASSGINNIGGAGAAAGNAPAGAAGRVLAKSHYLAFGAAGALLQHVRTHLGLAMAPRALQVEFDGVKHHMAIDRDAVTSLELLAPTRSRAALQKAIASTASASGAAAAAAAVLQAAQQDMPLGTQGTAPTRPIAGTQGGYATGSSNYTRGRRRASCKAAAAASCSSSKGSSSLFGFLNHTATACGARLLRTNLLQPLTDITTLELRLDSLQELLESPHLTLELVSLIDTLPKNLDKVCSNLAVRPSGSAGAAAAASCKDPSVQLGRLVSSVILLRDVLRCLPAMADSMAWVDSPLLKAIRANLGQGELQQLLQETEAVLDDDAQASKTQFVNKVQQCFAVRAQVDSLLDISRATFTRLTEAIHELAAKYRASTGIAALKVQYSSSKGFFLVVPEQQQGRQQAAATSMHGKGYGGGGSVAAASALQLPKTFLVLEKRGRNSTCVTTHELNALNSRLRDAAADCMMLTVQVLEQLVSKLLQHMPLLQRTLDNIALLDVLLSFFQAVAGSEGDFCRPVLTPAGPLAITQGRHPLLAALREPGFEVRPNDTFVTPCATLHLLTGPNMSGKSTYLKQVALLVVMAQIGCYVPATFMSLSPYISLHTRIGTSDSIESNASSFMVEMADMARLMARAGPRSLVLIDELGRATSTADGVALSWAMAEYLLALGAHVLLATHFRQLEELAAIYPSCKLWRMQVELQGDDIHYTRSIAPAAAEADSACSHYGILLARTAGLPQHITERAMQVAQQLEAKQQQQHLRQQQGQPRSERCLGQVYSLIHKLGCVARQAAAEGLLPDTAAAADTASAPAGGVEAAVAAAAALQRCQPLLAGLKQQAEKLLLQAAKQPQGAA